jgi:hypothetical protein
MATASERLCERAITLLACHVLPKGRELNMRDILVLNKVAPLAAAIDHTHHH